ncbi:MAG: hypothetical protein LQ351_001052 [Letrouitia transgressa]|nr:MAG: hypothetical protein LQ351_001052 [Letrouitia transgressa]
MSGTPHDEAPPPPPAPPLPPQRYGHRAATALARFAQPFIYASRPPSAHDNQPSESKLPNLRPNAQRSLSLPSRTIAHKTGIPIASLDISPSRTHVVLAGREILKTVQISDSTCTEDYNLRSEIIAYTAAHGNSGNVASARHRDQIIATDVKWAHGRYDTTIATAAANGQIVLYDLNRPGVELARLHEHSRQVHRVAFNPFEGALLLSGSQDATIRLWDLRALVGDKSVMTCTSRYTYPGNSEGIRDLRWSPTNGVEFAACTDNGAVQRWDFTKLNAPLLKINAHEKTCHSIDWHPDGKHLVSAGTDKNIKIWDFSSTDRRMKARWQLRAPRPVLNVRWRPSSWYYDHQGIGNWECTQLATSYDNQDPRLHVWDLCRPSIPFREVNLYDTAPTAMLWHSENLLWSVGNTGMFAQTDINFSTNVLSKRSVSSIAIAPDGSNALFSEKRSHRRTSIDDPSSDYLHRKRGTRNSTEKLSSSYSATDGSLEEPSLLTSSFKHRRRKVHSTRSSRSLASTPPSAGTGGTVINLEDAMQQDRIYHLAQIAACGPISGVADAEQFRFLACHYRFPPSLAKEKATHDIHQDLFEIFEYNAKCAAYVGQYRLAQSWNIVAFTTRGELETRANRNREKRLQDADYRDIDGDGSPLLKSEDTRQLAEPGGKDESLANNKSVRSGLAVPGALEYGSNMATPIAKPQPDPPLTYETGEQPPVLEESQTLRLPEPAFNKRSPPKQADISSGLTALRKSQVRSAFQGASPKSPPLESDAQAHNQTINLANLQNVDSNLHKRRATMENYRPPPRPVLRFEESFHMSGSNALPRFDRHDSDESFQMFSVSTNSSHRTRSVGGSFDSSLGSTRSDLAIEQWNNSFSHEMPVKKFHIDGIPRQDNSPFVSFSASNYQPVGELSTSIDNHPPTLHRSILPEPPIVHYDDFRTDDLSRNHSVPEPNTLTDQRYAESDFIPHTPDLGELGAQSAANQVKETGPTSVADANRTGLLARYAMAKALSLPQIPLIVRADRYMCMQAPGMRTICGIGVKSVVMEGTQVAYAYGGTMPALVRAVVQL